jgi:hypothetical protein
LVTLFGCAIDGEPIRTGVFQISAPISQSLAWPAHYGFRLPSSGSNGYEFAWRVSQAKEAERALDSVCRARFGTLRPESQRR